MYIVKGLEYENRYIEWAKKMYSNVSFYQTPHYATYSFVRNGYLGIRKDHLNKMKISIIDDLIKNKFEKEWSVYGFKKNDGITRRFMLKEYPAGIDFKVKKAYPLMDLKNHDVLNYISDNDLIQPFCYNPLKPSSGCDISDPSFLSYVKKKYPNDLNRIYEVYPFCEAILFRYENYGKN
jgi:sulfate adenylyltransferase subunit 2